MTIPNDNRGKIISRERRQQIVDFSKIRYGNITPTDIDGYIEKADRIFAYYELKYGDAKMPYGQRTALENMIDALTRDGKKAVLFLCRHNVHNPHEDIDAAETVVDELYFNFKWYKGRGIKLKQLSDRFFEKYG